MRELLNDRCVIVTGAGRGLGRAYAVDLAVAGAAVVVNDVDAEAAEEVVRELQSTGGDAVGDFHSVSDWETSGEIIQTALSTFGRLDGLVNNAGIFYVTDPQDEDPLMAAEMVQINLLGTLYCGQHAIRHMAGHGGGSIVN